MQIGVVDGVLWADEVKEGTGALATFGLSRLPHDHAL